MEYKGKLYGKVGKTYFPMVETAEDFDKFKQEHAEMVEMLEDVCNQLFKCDNLMASDVRQLLNKIKENGN